MLETFNHKGNKEQNWWEWKNRNGVIEYSKQNDNWNIRKTGNEIILSSYDSSKEYLLNIINISVLFSSFSLIADKYHIFWSAGFSRFLLVINIRLSVPSSVKWGDWTSWILVPLPILTHDCTIIQCTSFTRASIGQGTGDLKKLKQILDRLTFQYLWSDGR